jgi:hypothetical protein
MISSGSGGHIAPRGASFRLKDQRECVADDKPVQVTVA